MESNEIVINGETYVKKSSVQNLKQNTEGLEYVIVRTYSAGVFAGYLASRNGREVKILNARRLWQWYGAASLSQLALEGVKQPEKCKFPAEVSVIEVMEAIEILPCTEAAFESIKNVAVWKV